MFLIRFSLLIFSLLFCINSEILATKVFPIEKKCPVCLKIFITFDFYSYSSFGEPERDFYNSRFVKLGRILSCPHCLYSSIPSDFDRINESDREKLLKELPNITLKLNKLEKQVFSELSSTDESFAYIFARECNKIRSPDKEAEMEFLLHQYYFSKLRPSINKLHPMYRKNAIEGLKRLLDENFYKDKEEPVFTYLLGEFYRLDGQDDKALSQFKIAIDLAEKLPASEKWIKKWSFEQSCQINLPALSIQALSDLVNAPEANSEIINEQAIFKKDLAINILAKKNDAVSWAIIREYVNQDLKRLVHLNSIAKLSKENLQIDQKLWEWFLIQYQEAEKKINDSGKDTELICAKFQSNFFEYTDKYRGEYYEFDEEVKAILKQDSILFKYTIKPDNILKNPSDTLKRVAYRYHTSASRILELNPQLKDENSAELNTIIDLVKTPSDYSEAVFLSHVGKLIKTNNIEAQKYFFSWLKTIRPNNFYRFNNCILNCLLALKAINPNWQMPAETELNANKEQKMIYHCLLIIMGKENTEEKLFAYIKSKDINGISIPLGCLKACNNKNAKNIVLEILRDDPLYPDMATQSYLRWVAILDDIPTIKSLIKVPDSNLTAEMRQSQMHTQWEIEEIIILVKLKALLKNSLEDK